MIEQSLDGVRFFLKEPFDFSFLRDYGRVFCAFDENDSGNISFGLERGGQRYFVKVAGANTLRSVSTPEKAIAALRRTAMVYHDLAHPSLVEIVDTCEFDGGFAVVFRWRDGDCMHAHWTFDMWPKRTHPDSPFYRFIHLPEAELLAALKTLFEFQRHVSACGYVAIDFYDGSVMYDFERQQITVCDIDLYEQMPYINGMGRMWGASRFMSPEEFELGATIDELSNVFTMGATAFCFLGAERDRGFEHWRASRALYDVARKAVNPNRQERHPSIAAFIADWERAFG